MYQKKTVLALERKLLVKNVIVFSERGGFFSKTVPKSLRTSGPDSNWPDIILLNSNMKRILMGFDTIEINPVFPFFQIESTDFPLYLRMSLIIDPILKKTLKFDFCGQQ